MTKYLKETLYSYFNYDRNSYHNNIETFKLRNTRILKVVVVASILINLSNFIANCIHVNPSIKRGSYLTIIIFSSIIYLYLCVKEKLEYMFLIYIIYSILVAFTIYSSAFIMPDYIGFGIIAYIFFLPVLFIDKSWRINSLVIVFAAIYLGIVLPFKVENLRIDEAMNVCTFTILSIFIGSFTRKSIIENAEMKRQLEITAYTDALTGISNRRKLYESFTISEMMDCPYPIKAILIIDIDYFKQYNDTYGHQAGDKCLKRVGAFLKRIELETGAQIYRYGGEEFVATLTDKCSYSLEALCKELVQRVRILNIKNNGCTLGILTISIGGAKSNNASLREYEALLKRADTALYQAKETGRNKYCINHVEKEE